MILTVTEPRFYTHYTTTLALSSLAQDRQIPFTAFDLTQLKAHAFPAYDVRLIVLHAAHLKIARLTTGELKQAYPRAKLVTLGSDFIYYTRRYPDRHEGLLVDPRGYEFVRVEDVDLHLDLMNEVVEKLRVDGIPSARWYWTASAEGLRLAGELCAEEPEPEKTCDVICYANPNVSAPGGYRPRLTRELVARGRKIQWGGTTEFVTLSPDVLRDIYRTYRSAKVSLGTSSPSWTPCRTAKGWRDWIAPALGVPLIYDDLPEAIDIQGPAGLGQCPLNTFAYGDWEGLEALLKQYDDHRLRETVVCNQRKWIKENTLEKQFARVFDYYSLW